MPVRNVFTATGDIRKIALRLSAIAQSLHYVHGKTDLVDDLDHLSGSLMQDAIDIEKSVHDDLAASGKVARENAGLLLSAVLNGKIGGCESSQSASN